MDVYYTFVMNTRGDKAGFKCRAQQVFIAKDHRRRQVAGSRDRQGKG